MNEFEMFQSFVISVLCNANERKFLRDFRFGGMTGQVG
ncbi:hypothetical protein BURMUCF1_3187 [Burkholderia multivorans ATCC BAA-247]|uniref:Uncharacterized protein n=1 Tax=Burkholderia multivorans CGD2 TaxID=513052 RepID=B9BW66_9BURK|nr:hypothetical protein BURMUCGD2_3395 [Burkholderia multivorans CGD2]EEE10726.1 hypothetical protein BURMUCGD2M_3388 [Burkholderia multivorans CGD2M]EJO56625.1 hypothetical protein BURMUCF1_3187 [Burkholderia multivorans ATCC BAA-247]